MDLGLELKRRRRRRTDNRNNFIVRGGKCAKNEHNAQCTHNKNLFDAYFIFVDLEQLFT